MSFCPRSSGPLCVAPPPFPSSGSPGVVLVISRTSVRGGIFRRRRRPPPIAAQTSAHAPVAGPGSGLTRHLCAREALGADASSSPVLEASFFEVQQAPLRRPRVAGCLGAAMFRRPRFVGSSPPRNLPGCRSRVATLGPASVEAAEYLAESAPPSAGLRLEMLREVYTLLGLALRNVGSMSLKVSPEPTILRVVPTMFGHESARFG